MNSSVLADAPPTSDPIEPIAEDSDALSQVEEGETAAADVFERIKDFGFVRYIQVEQLGAAWNDLDAGLMSDLALQLAEGERVLMRNHHSGITSQKLFGLARRIAIEKGDNYCLDRLERASARNGSLAADLGDAKQVYGRAQAVNPTAMLLAEDASPEQISEVHEAVMQITRLRLAGDEAGLRELNARSNVESGLPAAQAHYLRQLIQDASESTRGAEGADSMADVLRGLSAANDGNGSNRNEVRARVAAGGWTVMWGVNVNEAEYARFIAAVAAAVASVNPAPIAQYISDYAERTWLKVKAAFPGAVKSAVIGFILRAIKSGGSQTRFGSMGVKAGVATYQRWYHVSARVPDGTERYKIHGPWGTWTWGYRPKFKTIQRKISLPNHHTPYVAFRI
jgi:hypothetical protein